MSTDSGEGGDPATDARATYDYQSDDVDRPGLVADLDSLVDGDVRFDEYTRQLYATDASAYEVTPVGVVFPADTADVSAVVEYCADREIPVLPRGGGTSLAGQAVNEAVVLDLSRHMDAVLDVDPDAREARTQAGTILEDLNAACEPHGLKFAPDPAAGNRSVVGGAIGNNSTGAHSLKYGKTDAYVEECEVVLSEGTITTFGEITLDELWDDADPDGDLLERIYAEVARIIDEDADEVEGQYPDLKRNVSGYNLDVLIEEAREAQRASNEANGGAVSQREADTINLARLLAGSEGTLAIVTEATLSLEQIPETKSLALLTYRSVVDAMEDVPRILEHDAAAVELIDDVLLDLARSTAEFEDVADLVPDGAEAALLVEFYAENDEDGEAKVADLLTDRVPEEGRGEGDTPAFAAFEAHDPDTRSRFWKLRKAGLPILLSKTSDAKHISFIEDCAIPPEHLADYVQAFQAILEEHDTFASFYAHAGPGVLHVRPLINTKDPVDLEAMEAISDAVTDLVVEYNGSVSGEHGDGRARTQWNRKLYGDRLWQTFRDLKRAFDPDWLLNPGQVCGDVSMTENLRFDPEYEFDAGFDPTLEWENENGFQGMTELCHGCGGCRGHQDTTGGVMCPTYRASEEELTATRGRANALRKAMSGDLPEDEVFSDEFQEEVLDLCVGCKGCKLDCPSEVDMAKLKAEVTHEYHQRNGASLRDHLFANVDTLAGLGSLTAPLSNLLPQIPGARWAMEQTVGISRDRSLPEFRRETLQDWWADRGGPRIEHEHADRRVVLFPDTFTNYANPELGQAAVRVLEAAGVHVELADRTDSGRPAHSKGFLDRSKAAARANVEDLEPLIEDGWDVVLVEPSDAVMFQSDYLDLLGDDARTLAENTYGLCEYLDVHHLDDAIAFTDDAGEPLVYHGHCHQKSTKKDHHAVGVLRRAGYDVTPLDSGCCGMAGTFGYEAEHDSMSRAIGSILGDQVDAESGTVVAPGESCRTQLEDVVGEPDAPHPVEKLAAALLD